MAKIKKSKKDWLQKGLQILAQKGEASLTIEHLCSLLKVTKGSFYHHFAGRKNYVEELFEHWNELYTQEIIKVVQKEKTPQEQAHVLIQHALKIPTAMEIAIRSWALRDGKVRQFLEKIDQQRRNFLFSIILPLQNDPKQAHVLADLVYACYIGCHQMLPQIKDDQYLGIFNHLLGLLSLSPYPNQ